MPPPGDLAVPFNALMDNKGQYLGHKADLSILLSLSVVEKTQGTQKKAKKYLGVADTLISSDLVHSSTEITNLDNLT